MMIMVQMQLVLLAMVLFVLMARSRALSMEFSILPISSVACQWGSWQGALRNLWICGPCLILYPSQIRERYKLWTQPRHVQTISNHFSICIRSNIYIYIIVYHIYIYIYHNICMYIIVYNCISHIYICIQYLPHDYPQYFPSMIHGSSRSLLWCHSSWASTPFLPSSWSNCVIWPQQFGSCYLGDVLACSRGCTWGDFCNYHHGEITEITEITRTSCDMTSELWPYGGFWNRVAPNHPIQMDFHGFPIINHPFGGTPMTMETPSRRSRILRNHEIKRQFNRQSSWRLSTFAFSNWSHKATASMPKICARAFYRTLRRDSQCTEHLRSIHFSGAWWKWKKSATWQHNTTG